MWFEDTCTKNGEKPKPIHIIFSVDYREGQWIQTTKCIDTSSSEKNSEILAFEVGAVKPEERMTMCVTEGRCAVADKNPLEFTVLITFDDGCSMWIGIDKVLTVFIAVV